MDGSADTSMRRPQDVFGGTNNIHFSGEHINYVTLPVVPPKSG